MSDRNVIEVRREHSRQRLANTRQVLNGLLAAGRTAQSLQNTCLYVTGSAGRGELAQKSDLDVFCVRVTHPLADHAQPEPGGEAKADAERRLLDQKLLQAVIIEAMHTLGFDPPSNGGEFLELHTSQRLCRLLGDPSDDTENTFTARMLLLLESELLVGAESYERLVREVLAQYWENWGRFSEERRASYVPILLVNDVVRFWRILLLNYVAKNIRHDKKDSMDAEKGLRSYKLRFSRCLTCYSVLFEFLHCERTGTVLTPEVAAQIVRRKPVERLEFLEQRVDGALRPRVAALIDQYAEFLRVSGAPTARADFEDLALRKRTLKDGEAFGTAVFELLMGLAKPKSRMLRYIVV